MSPLPSLSHDLGWGADEAALLADAIRFIDEHCEMADGAVELTFSGGQRSGNHFPPESRKLLMAAAEAVGGRRGGKVFVTGLFAARHAEF